jgi:hypothetical protein
MVFESSQGGCFLLSRVAKSFFLWGVIVAATLPARLSAQAALLLEEPYSYDGTFAGTGHAAVYLSRVCADSPVQLRRCRAGENGVVISRYHGVAGRDWIAIPLFPYLYAVSNPDDIPLYADTKLVALLREQYLSTLPLPAEKHAGDEPRYELAGSAYDRTLYGFRFATRPEQDDELIRLLNSKPNTESYQLLKRNCADFAKQIVNFYYPKAVHRSVIADLGVMTPKQTAKSLVHSGKHRPQMRLTTFIIPQVPGLKRSKPVHGVLESVVLAKKYVTPVLLFHPFVIGTVEAAYWAGWRFDPAKGAYIFDASAPDPIRNLELPLTQPQRRAYEDLVAAAKRANAESGQTPDWKTLAGSSEPRLDAEGRPFLQVSMDGDTVPVGLCRSNTLRLSGSSDLVQELALARLETELKSKKPARVSERGVKTDWKLLQDARDAREAELDPSH